ncbi:hypothetical protein SDC9_55742 [bioreactor metagenome]|uniref:Uncharacterized protein n=1 Tax=bioreactor metagenome TaxID=1076179 RepID=A0A644WZT6_9ZZZZ
MENFGTCNKCGCLTSKHKLEEFNGICEDCYYEEKEEK